MPTCVIFCGGEFTALARPIRETDYLLAADSGLTHMQTLGLTPHGIIGDFDSLGYVPQGAQVFPVEKDDTDSRLAIRKGLELGYRDFLLYGALGGKRLDHTLANLQALRFLADHGARGCLVGKDVSVTTVTDGTATFPAAAKGILSVFCLGESVTGVTLQGLKYTLENARLTPGFPLGVSNRFLGKEATVTVKNGTLFLLFDTTTPTPDFHTPKASPVRGREPVRCRWQMKHRRSVCRGRQDASLLRQAQRLPGTANGDPRRFTQGIATPTCGGLAMTGKLGRRWGIGG